MMTKPCLKIALFILTLGSVFYRPPSLMPGENDRSEPSPRISGDTTQSVEPESTVATDANAEEETDATSDILTITTYTGFLEGHLITFPDGTIMSIDCGDRYASADITTKSHFHTDHCADCGSGDYNRNNVAPGDVIYSDDDRDITVTVVAANGAVIGQEPAGYIPCPGYENPLSMALLVKYKGFDYLTAGDMDSYVENPLGAALKERGVNVDVFKASHHGSSTSTMLSTLCHKYDDI